MIYFFAGLITGAVLAAIPVLARRRVNTPAIEDNASSEDVVRSNAKKEERAKLLQELERQYDQMMRYTGKEQRT